MTIPLFSHRGKAAETQPLLARSAAQTQHELRTEMVGLSLMAFSTLGYSCMTVLIRLAELRYHFHPASSVLLRGILHTLAAAVLAFAVFDTSVSSLSWRLRRLLLFRGAIGACGMLCLYNALGLIPAGNVMSIFAFSPVITMTMSHFALGEHATIIDALGAVVGLIGIYLIAQPDTLASSASSHLLGSFLALCGASFASMGYVSVRRMGATVHFSLNVFSLSSFCVLGSAILGRVQAISDIFTNVSGRNIVILAALFAFLGQCFLNKGLQMCKAGPGTIMRNLDVPLVYIMAIFLLGEKPDKVRLLGSSLVVFASLLVGLSKLFNS